MYMGWNCFYKNLHDQHISTRIEFKTLMNIMSGKSVDYLSLNIFEALVFVNINQGKLDTWVVKCVFIVYSKGVMGYKL